MKNTLKQPEAKGKGLNLTHLLKVEAERRKDDYIRFKCTKGDKIAFKLACNDLEGMNESEVLRALMLAFTKGKIKIK